MRTLSALSQRMLEAAATIAELNHRYQLGQHVPWEPDSLLREASVVASEESDARQGAPV